MCIRDRFHPVGDGSTALYYEKDKIQQDYKAMADYVMSFTEKYHMTFPGWEPERMAKLDELFEKYAPVTKEKLWENLKYFRFSHSFSLVTGAYFSNSSSSLAIRSGSQPGKVMWYFSVKDMT